MKSSVWLKRIASFCAMLLCITFASANGVAPTQSNQVPNYTYKIDTCLNKLSKIDSVIGILSAKSAQNPVTVIQNCGKCISDTNNKNSANQITGTPNWIYIGILVQTVLMFLMFLKVFSISPKLIRQLTNKFYDATIEKMASDAEPPKSPTMEPEKAGKSVVINTRYDFAKGSNSKDEKNLPKGE